MSAFDEAGKKSRSLILILAFSLFSTAETFSTEIKLISDEEVASRREVMRSASAKEMKLIAIKATCDFHALKGPRRSIHIGTANSIDKRNWKIAQNTFQFALQNILNPSMPATKKSALFSKNGAFTIGDYLSECGFVAFRPEYQTNSLTERSIDVVLHEVSHWIDFSTRRQNLYLGRINEALADLMSQLYLNNPCHQPARYIGTDQCSRRMDVDATIYDNPILPHRDDFGMRLRGWRNYNGRFSSFRNEFQKLRSAYINEALVFDEGKYYAGYFSENEINFYKMLDVKLAKEFFISN